MEDRNLAWQKQLTEETPPAVVTPLDKHMGLDIARSLAKHGIPVYALDPGRGPARHSNSCYPIKCPKLRSDNGADFLQFLVDFGKKLGQKSVLYPLSDLHALFCSRHRATLQEYYEYVMPDHEAMEKLATKDGLQAVAREYDIPAPQTIFVKDASEVEVIASHITYPVILKPILSPYWHVTQIQRLLCHGLLDSQAKVILCDNPPQLLQAYRRVAAYDDRLVVQEVIPGEDSRLSYFSFYMNRQSKPLGIFAGRKYRTLPTGFGSASYVKSFHDPELEEIVLKLLSATQYKGLGGIEFKKDPRDARYKLIEFNTRFGMWDGLSVRCGVDLPYLAYCDALGLPMEPQLKYRDGVIWIDWERDVRAAFEYWRKGQLSFSEWLRSLRGEKVCAIFSRDDWFPGAFYALDLALRLWERI
jgi:predicted ATP-grasp superfamily ATP-dependent carboligase